MAQKVVEIALKYTLIFLKIYFILNTLKSIFVNTDTVLVHDLHKYPKVLQLPWDSFI